MTKPTRRTVLCLLTVVVTLTGAKAAGVQSDPPRLRITVRIRDHAEVPKWMLRNAAGTARRIFLAAGVDTAWLDCGARSLEEARDEGCLKKSGAADIQLRILRKGQVKTRGLPRAALGSAVVPAGGHGSIANAFFHRVDEIARWTGVARALVLGHIMAHEVGHLLSHQRRHSSKGVMRAAWDGKDLLRTVSVSLRFTPREAERIRRNVSERMSGDLLDVLGSTEDDPRKPENRGASSQQLVDQAAAYVGEAEVSALIAER